MGVVFKQSSITSVSSYVGVIIGYVNVLWIFPAVLSAEEIGLMRLLPSMAFLFIPFTQLGLSQSILKFYPEFSGSKKGKSELISFTLLANLIGFGLMIFLLQLFEEEVYHFFQSKSALANDYIHVAVILVLILSYQTIFESFARSILKIIFPGLVRDIVVRLLYSLLVLLFFIEAITFSQLINSLIIIYLLALLLLVNYVIKKASLKFTYRFELINKDKVREIFQFSVFTLLGASGNYIMLNIDQLMISNLVGLEGNGVYTTAFYIAIVIEMPRRAIGSITTPLISQLFKENKIVEINKLYRQVSINQMVVGSLLLIGILVNLETLFRMIPNDQVYRAGTSVVYIIGLAKLIDMTFGINSEIILMSRYFRYNVTFTVVLAFLAVITNYFLIQQYGITGAALATGITLLVFNLIKMVFLKVRLGLWPFSWNNVLVMAIGGFTYLIIVQIPHLINGWIDLGVRSIITSILFVIPCLILKVSPEINTVVYKFTGLKFLFPKE